MKFIRSVYYNIGMVLNKQLIRCMCLWLFITKVDAQTLQRPYSYVPYNDQPPCYDTIRFLGYQRVIDQGLIIPEWKPVRHHHDNVVFEGTVIKTPNTVSINTHISAEDFPLYHYTHDFSFNAIPDIYPDKRYENLLNYIITLHDDGTADTTLSEHLHIEWETGLGAMQKNNPCAEKNRKGESCGFFTSGHERKDIIWNFPTIGDWVHVEGLWVWDRGHPPFQTEIHPMRLIAIRRNLPEKILHPDTQKEIWATRIDLYAKGDGGALYNNLPEQPPFVHRVNIGEKNYDFLIRPVIPKPSLFASLKYIIYTQKGHTFPKPIMINHTRNERFEDALHILIPWKGLSDTFTLAQTIFAFWDENNGKRNDYKIYTYRVTLEEMIFHRRKEFISRSEFRATAEVGGKYLFLNEWFGRNDILTTGMGKTYRKRWKLNLSFDVHLSESAEFRVHANCWEADGVDRILGNLFDPYVPCTKENRKQFRKALRIISPFRMRGCLNDLMGEIHDFHSVKSIREGLYLQSYTRGSVHDDICLCNSDRQEKAMSLRYKIDLISVE